MPLHQQRRRTQRRNLGSASPRRQTRGMRISRLRQRKSSLQQLGRNFPQQQRLKLLRKLQRTHQSGGVGRKLTPMLSVSIIPTCLSNTKFFCIKVVVLLIAKGRILHQAQLSDLIVESCFKAGCTGDFDSNS